MSIKSTGGVFGRNPTFNDVTVEGDLSIAGTLSVGGETITGLSYQGGWNADTNTPDIAASSPVTGQFWIVSVDGSTDVGGITNWTSGDWALYDGTNWQRVEGGNTDLSTGVTGQLAVANGGTGAADASTARTNLGLGTVASSNSYNDLDDLPTLGTAAATDSTDYATSAQGSLADSALQSSDIGSTVEAYDATILKSADIGSTVQGYDSYTAKLDEVQTFRSKQSFSSTATTPSAYVHVVPTDAELNNKLVGLRVSRSISLKDAQYLTLSQASGAATITSTVTSGGAGGTIKFASSADGSTTTDLASINTSGDILPVRNIVVSSGNGIDFSATSGTGTSELLDDYEEGTFTPVYEGSTTNPTYSAAPATYGRYVKIGNMVHVEGHIETFSFVSQGVGNLLLAGFPFTFISTGNTNHRISVPVSSDRFVSGNTGAHLLANAGTSNMTIIQATDDPDTDGATSSSAASAASLSTTNFYNRIWFSFTYRTA